MTKRFRIRWASTLAMVGTSILFAAFILHILASAS